MDRVVDNPLHSPQRNKSGSQTFDKYDYQYHWALYRIITEHMTSNDYAVFIEYHEDVVFVNSLDKTIAKFEFNQIKTDEQKFSLAKLTRIPKNSQSILAKLISSCHNKPFTQQINEINLIATSGFNLDLKHPDIKYEKITIPDLTNSFIVKLEQKIKSEIQISTLPVNLQFIISDLPNIKFQETVIGEISKLIHTLSPTPSFNPVDIYRILIDELRKKGIVTFDYNKWDDALEKKALTSIKVTEVINEFTSTIYEEKYQTYFQEIVTELKLNVINRDSLRKAFNRYKLQRLGNRSATKLSTSKKICTLINSFLKNSGDEIAEMIQYVNDNLPLKIKEQFQSKIEIDAAIIFEYIKDNLNG
ncbi:MAG: DUF4297 domain-containing protein [Spirochaetae bacterium HGW-Spirochaetae-5]|nr:MAG: DUF4297 domain-containing protein [Spirochaetae bacterium HGW-Spirochaetae-5]